MKLFATHFKERTKKSKFIRDSLWSVMGNGIGDFLLLIGGIIIARILGKDLYGEYGVVKTTMFYIAAFSTLGLGFTATKFVAEYIERGGEQVGAIVVSSLKITIISSSSLCLLLLLFADSIAEFANEPNLTLPFRFLGPIIICRALNTTSTALLAGMKKFKTIGISTIVSGAALLVFGAFLTFYFGVLGSLSALLLSQIINVIVLFISLYQEIKGTQIGNKNFTWPLLTFSLPVTLQEFVYAITNWLTTLILTRYASVGQIGLWTAAGQWNAIISAIPGLLSNVILSYLSSNTDNAKSQQLLMNRMLMINFVSVFIPFVVVCLFSGHISSFYGPSFGGMSSVLNVLMFSSFFTCLSSVYQSSMIAHGKVWALFVLRLLRDISITLILYLILSNGISGSALSLAYIYLIVYIVYFMLLAALQSQWLNNFRK